MALKKGICKNPGCFMMNEIQEAEEERFECSECHESLTEWKDGATGSPVNKKLFMLVGVAVLVIAIVVCLIAFAGGDDKASVDYLPTTEIPEPAPETSLVPEPQVDTMEAKDIVPEPAAEPQDDVVDALDTAPEPAKEAIEESTGKTNPPTSYTGKGTYYFDYGVYVGDLRNGLPHGYGTITYTKTHQIVSSKDYVASKGDTLEEAECREGRVDSGYWVHGGNKTFVKR